MTTKEFDQPGSLMLETIRLLKAHPLSLPEIYRETDIPFYWLGKFQRGEFKNPSVNRVQFIYEYLSGKNL